MLLQQILNFDISFGQIFRRSIQACVLKRQGGERASLVLFRLRKAYSILQWTEWTTPHERSKQSAPSVEMAKYLPLALTTFRTQHLTVILPLIITLTIPKFFEVVTIVRGTYFPKTSKTIQKKRTTKPERGFEFRIPQAVQPKVLPYNPSRPLSCKFRQKLPLQVYPYQRVLVRV